MRRRRHEIEYPSPGKTSDVTASEISQTLVQAEAMVDAARALVVEVGLF